MNAKADPKPCHTCGKPFKPLRNGRCHACDTYWRRSGVERPYNLDGRGERVDPEPCSRCGRPWAYVKGLCKSCYRVKQRCDSEGISLPPFNYAAADRAVMRDLEVARTALLEVEINALRMEFSEIRNRMQKLEKTVSGLSSTRKKRAKPTVETTVDQSTLLLDDIARGMAKKPFSQLSSVHQEAVRKIAEKLQSESAS